MKTFRSPDGETFELIDWIPHTQERISEYDWRECAALSKDGMEYSAWANRCMDSVEIDWETLEGE